MHIPYACIG